MAFHRWADLMAKKYTPEQRAAMRARTELEIDHMNLRALRKAARKTQAEVAKLAGMDRADIARIERRQDLRPSALRSYLRALGGDLEVDAVVGDKRVRIRLIG